MANVKDALHLGAAVHPLPSGAFFRRNAGEFCLPITQDVRLHAGDPADITDAVVKPIGDLRTIRKLVLVNVFGHFSEDRTTLTTWVNFRTWSLCLGQQAQAKAIWR